VELDSLTGRIAQQLYQNADVRVKGFEEVGYPDNYFDLFISNVPFGNYKIYDAELKNLNFNIHDFFFAKALKKTRPGGLVAFITTKGTMDKTDSGVRAYLAGQADLVGAIRLPNTAFKATANTEVVTDILVFQKRDPKKFYGGEKFKQVTSHKVGEETFDINEYFAAHPDNILGRLAYSGSMYRANELTVEGTGVNLERAIRDKLSAMTLPESMQAQRDAAAAKLRSADELAPAPEKLKEYALTIGEDGTVQQKVGDQLVPVKTPKNAVRKVKGMIAVRDAARSLLHKQLDPDASDADLASARDALNKAYDRFVKRYGPISNIRKTGKWFKEDPDFPLLLSLEKYDADTDTARKAEIFTKRTQQPHIPIETAGTAEEALIASLNERASVDLGYMARISGGTVETIVEELGNLIYEDPESGWQTAETYLSGNVRQKLQAAQQAAKLDAKYQRNVEALKKVQPEDIPAGDIEVHLGASWVPEEDYSAFIQHLVGRQVKVHKVTASGTWILDYNRYEMGSERESFDRYEMGSERESFDWGTPEIGALELIGLTLNHKDAVVRHKQPDGTSVVSPEETVAARAKQDAIKAEFQRWIFDDTADATGPPL